MKNTIKFLLISVFICIFMTACGTTEKQDAILKYINEDIPALSELEEAFNASFTSVTEKNYIDDETMHKEFTENTLRLAKELNEKIVKLDKTITDEDIKAVHKLYIEYSEKCVSAIDLMIHALEEGDPAKVAEANAILEDASKLGDDYREKLYKIAEENNIEITEKE